MLHLKKQSKSLKHYYMEISNNVEFSCTNKDFNVRELEKSTAEKSYYQSMEVFESIAKKLYTALKKKEDAEDSYEQSLQSSTSIDIIKEQSLYIEMLNSQILTLQVQVQKAR